MRIANSLVQPPDLILFDEPARGVDVIAKRTRPLPSRAAEGKAAKLFCAPEASLKRLSFATIR